MNQPADSVGKDSAQPASRSIFVAYAYNLYDKRDYRKVFADLEKAYDVRFIFADEKITNMHILQKIISYIKASDFSLFDISGWNPNVTLELGIALAHSDNWYICFNPEKTPIAEVPSDIKGIDRIQYSSFSDLSDKLTTLLEQRYPKQKRQPLDEYVLTLEQDVVALLGKKPGLKMNEIAQILRLSVKMAQVVVLPMVGAKLRVEGQTRGSRYFLREQVLESKVLLPSPPN
ncbi:MAG: Uncharacterized protein FD161_3448 [Limisphaerales bacterium]|nr:MAG: Uncharacterized protein FD161_3448 [Limisphaerales bacterium]KAG0507769.1 MAG: Uncharacterized protein E1N63_3114 [Limisphaerales bacterium]TXT51066.1 MAG: Uncharacterized protein FD140_1912 [Limisphaerales bacterium]